MSSFVHSVSHRGFALRGILLLLVMHLLLPIGSRAQDTSNVNTARLCMVGAVVVSTVAAVHIYQRDAWWQGEVEPFRFENDWDYALNADKFGHCYGAYSESKIARAVLGWCGFSDKTSLVFGSVIGWSYQMYVEVEDGYHKTYGFSPGDAISNTIGASIPLLQTTFPLLRNFSMKYSYYPSQEYLNELKTDGGKAFFDDYEGTVVWITMDPHFLMSEEMASAVPQWIGVSLGVAAHNLSSGEGQRLIYFTADYQFSKIRTDSDFLRAVYGALDFFHPPAPGIAVEDGKLKVGIFYTYHVQVTL